MQCNEAELGWYLPEGQMVHTVALPALASYFPEGHTENTESPAVAHV